MLACVCFIFVVLTCTFLMYNVRVHTISTTQIGKPSQVWIPRSYCSSSTNLILKKKSTFKLNSRKQSIYIHTCRMYFTNEFHTCTLYMYNHLNNKCMQFYSYQLGFLIFNQNVDLQADDSFEHKVNKINDSE